jgi:hypothetical protein
VTGVRGGEVVGLAEPVVAGTVVELVLDSDFEVELQLARSGTANKAPMM